MDFKNFIPAVLGILGLSAFREVDGKKTLSAEERAVLKGYDFSDRFLDDFEAALNAPESGKGKDTPEDKKSAVLAVVLGQTTAQLQTKTAELNTLKAEKSTTESTLAAKEEEIVALKEKIKILSDMPDTESTGNAGQQTPSTGTYNIHDDRQLGGCQGVMFALDRPYNVRAKAALLAREGKMLAVDDVSPMDYSRLKEDLGAFYRTPWRDRVQSLLAVLPSLEKYFKLESGYQDLATLVNIWLGEFSQAENTVGSTFNNVVKGSYEFNHETLRMYGVMFVHRFSDLKQIEKLWIGSLNREGSNPLKWSFIEYLLTETAKKLHNERELRRVNGVRKNPDPNKPGRAMAASDGLYEFIRKKVDGHIDYTPDGGTTGKTVYQIKPFALPRITPGNIGEVFYLGTSMIPSVIRDTGKLVLYVPSFMMPWYHKYNEAHYGQNTNYAGEINCVKEYPSVKIVTIPNADNHYRIIWTIEDNIKLYEGKPGEMLNFQIEQEDWSLKVWSNWKESVWAEAVGFKYTERAKMDGSRQMIWCNDYDRPDTYFIESDPDVNPSAMLHTSILTAVNSKAFAITDIDSAPVGVVISLKCGADGDNGVSIAKTEKFELLSEAWNPSIGDILKVMKRADGKFIEIGRETAADNSYQFPADATTPNLEGATVFVTNENTTATAITDLLNAVTGTVYTIHGAGEANASTIANAGKFVLTDAMTLKAGTFIQLAKAADGKFYEVARG